MRIRENAFRKNRNCGQYLYIALFSLLLAGLSCQYTCQHNMGAASPAAKKNLPNMFSWCWCSPPSCRDHTDVTKSTFLISILDRHHLPASMYPIHQPRPKLIGLYLDSLLSLGQLTILAWSTKLSRGKWKEDGSDLSLKMGLKVKIRWVWPQAMLARWPEQGRTHEGLLEPRRADAVDLWNLFISNIPHHTHYTHRNWGNSAFILRKRG